MYIRLTPEIVIKVLRGEAVWLEVLDAPMQSEDEESWPSLQSSGGEEDLLPVPSEEGQQG